MLFGPELRDRRALVTAFRQGEPGFDELENRLACSPTIAVPTITLEGDGNGAPHIDAAVYAKKIGWYLHRVASGGIGHNLTQLRRSSQKRCSTFRARRIKVSRRRSASVTAEGMRIHNVIAACECEGN